jgi:hypothetical protein
MHAQLMGAAGEWLEPQPGEVMRTTSGIACSLCSLARGTAASGSVTAAERPSTVHVVAAGWPAGSCFIHQPRVASLRPSGSSIRPSSALGPPATTAQ